MIILKHLFPALCVRIVFVASISFAFTTSAAFAEKPESNDLECGKKATELQQKQCRNSVKRQQLQTKKLIPQLRSEELDRDKEFDLNKLYPFIVGSGLIN